jgi:hypothetical protein
MIPVIMKVCRAFRSHHDPGIMIARIKGARRQPEAPLIALIMDGSQGADPATG